MPLPASSGSGLPLTRGCITPISALSPHSLVLFLPGSCPHLSLTGTLVTGFS